MHFVTNLFPVMAVQNLSKSVKICQSYWQKFAATFIMPHNVQFTCTQANNAHMHKWWPSTCSQYVSLYIQVEIQLHKINGNKLNEQSWLWHTARAQLQLTVLLSRWDKTCTFSTATSCKLDTRRCAVYHLSDYYCTTHTHTIHKFLLYPLYSSNQYHKSAFKNDTK